MRCVVRVIVPAVILVLAGCSLFRDPNVQVATITAVVAPDTAHAGSTFHATVTACLGPTSGYVLDRFEVSSSRAELTVQAWSRFSAEGGVEYQVPVYQDLEVGASSSEPGTFRIIAIQPDGKETLKTITVLP